MELDIVGIKVERKFKGEKGKSKPSEHVRYSLIAADSISKLIIVAAIGIGLGLRFREEALCTTV
ncbi:hypothetical protein ACPWME_21475, partial [Pandoraea pneumonica]|uniref:hypothetical protein n=1 Tax=Pandoraea pneumonica TaxID=2508299 RepID=UPI003CF9D7FF